MYIITIFTQGLTTGSLPTFVNNKLIMYIISILTQGLTTGSLPTFVDVGANFDGYQIVEGPYIRCATGQSTD